MINGKIHSVLGLVDPELIGPTLMHEHVFLDHRAMMRVPDKQSPHWQDINAPVDISLLSALRRQPLGTCLDNLLLDDETVATRELLNYVKEGGSAIVDCTVKGIKPNPMALQRISKATGLHIIQGTGLYIEKSHPPWVRIADVDEISELFVRELTEGIDDTGVCAGIIGEIGTSGIERIGNGGPDQRTGDITAEEKKVLRAAGRASVLTGAAVTVHLDPRGKGAFEVIDVLAGEGVEPERMIMGHMDANPNFDYHLEIAKRGVYVEYDHFGREYYAGHMTRAYPSDERRVELLCGLLHAGYEDHILLSQDICMKIDLQTYGGVGYRHILGELTMIFRRAGISDVQINTMLVQNPQRVLSF